jgi:hypothetical protein
VAARRSPVALTDAVTRELRYRIRLAVVAGGTAALMAWLLTGFLRPDGQPALGEASVGGLAFLAAAIPTFAAPYVTSPRRRQAMEALYWAAGRSAASSSARTGERRIPATPQQAVAWLERQPDRDEARSLRVYCQLVVGNLPAAHELAGRLPNASPGERVSRQATLALIRLVEGADPDVAALRVLGADVDDDEARRDAQTGAAMLEALVAAADGGDWTSPLARLRRDLGASAGRGVLIRAWLPMIAYLLAGSLLLGIGGYAIRAALS